MTLLQLDAGVKKSNSLMKVVSLSQMPLFSHLYPITDVNVLLLTGLAVTINVVIFTAVQFAT